MTDKEILARIEEKMGVKAEVFADNKFFVSRPAAFGIIWTPSQKITHLKFNEFIGELPSDISQLTDLKELVFQHCDIKTLPAWIGNLSKLEYLLMYGCNTEAILGDFSKLTQLVKLLLLHNNISSISPVYQLSNLEHLELFHNNSCLTISDEIAKLKKIKVIDFEQSKIKRIPIGLVELGLPFIFGGSLGKRGIYLNGVTLEEGDISLFSQPREVIEAFYFGQQTPQDTARVRECKVIFLGDGNAGKSALIERMMKDTFIEGKPPTEGVRMHNWEMEMAGEDPAALRILDFGGQEIMHAMHRCFLTRHTVYVIVCESRADSDIDRDAARWLETVRSFAEDSPVILALNKCDVNPNIDVNRRGLMKICPGLRVVRTSAAWDRERGVGELLSVIREAVAGRLKTLDTFPANWLTIKQTLSGMEKPYIEDEAYRVLCRENKLDGRELQNQVLDWFGDLGVAYHYHDSGFDNPLLEQIRVLNPAWLTNGIYRLILRTPERGGLLRHREIEEVLKAFHSGDIHPEIVYTRQETQFILFVMRQFEISHKLGREELIPMKLPKTPPLSADDFPTGRSLRISWEGDYFPSTAVHRLMIRKVRDLDTDCIWRGGARFADRENERSALVEMRERCIDLYVDAANDRRIYLEELRREMLNILRELNLNCEEYLYCTVNGQVGKVSYKAVIRHYHEGKPEVYIPNLDTFANTRDILFENYTPEAVERYAPGAVYNGPVNIYNGPVHNEQYNQLIQSITARESLPQHDYDEITGELRRIRGVLDGQAKEEVDAVLSDKKSASGWTRLKGLLTNSNLVMSVMLNAPKLYELLSNLFGGNTP